MIGLLYVLFGQVLDPLTALCAGLSRIGGHCGSLQRAPPRARDRAGRKSYTEPAADQRAGRRTRTALELHDEVGPCLFGLKVCAASVAAAAAKLPEKAARKMFGRAREIDSVEHLQAINRTMLGRLRPMALGYAPLKDILEQLVGERVRQTPQTSFELRAQGLAPSYGDSIDLTVYRCIQESLTNAIRHAQAQHVVIDIHHDGAAALLKVTVHERPRHGCGRVGGIGNPPACRSALRAYAAIILYDASASPIAAFATRAAPG
jgi:two-component system sensor histidine kinase UhpB